MGASSSSPFGGKAQCVPGSEGEAGCGVQSGGAPWLLFTARSPPGPSRSFWRGVVDGLPWNRVAEAWRRVVEIVIACEEIMNNQEVLM